MKLKNINILIHKIFLNNSNHYLYKYLCECDNYIKKRLNCYFFDKDSKL